VNARLNRLQIERLLPQKGSMCLIDAVLEWTTDGITCTADASREGNPLRDDHGVSVVHSIEYGAQAAALHRLTLDQERGKVSAGLLLQARDVSFLVEYIDRLPQPLLVAARCAMASSETARYVYEIRAGEILASSGELTLRLM
jgi:predicted hotdog family 3-hydroxylacyl-ACP dehydratase